MDMPNRENSNDPTVRLSPLPLVAKDHENDGKFHLLLAASGSVATIKLPNIIRGLANNENIAIRILLTQSAAQFLQGQSEEQPDLSALSKYPHVEAIYQDEDEWKVPWIRGNHILHIELRRWADLLVIAPLSANTLAKLSNGLCDNLLTSVVRAWEVQPQFLKAEAASTNGGLSGPDASQKFIAVAPAMNTAMWRHPLTASHLHRLVFPVPDQLNSWIRVLMPIEKELACRDTGDGAMADWKDIVSMIQESTATVIVNHQAG